MKDEIRPRELGAWRIVLVVSALWTASGALPGLFDAAQTFERFYGEPAESARLLAIYRGAWGQSLLFGVGYLIAAFDPFRHALVVALGAVGKTVYALGLLRVAGEGGAGPLAVVAGVGDILFAVLFVSLLLRLQPWRRGIDRR